METNNYIESFNKTKFLYHYTTIESLLFILTNKVIKFNGVDQFNDISESKRNKYVKFFACCLTHSPIESIPLWNIYANREYGVRIKFQNIDIFNTEFYYYDKRGNKVTGDLTQVGNILRGQVLYDDKLAKKSPSIGTASFRATHVYEMACHKREVWSYEEELRYFIVDNILINKAKCLYVSLNNNFFDNLEITFSPFVPMYKKPIIIEAVNNLLYKNIKFNDSKLKNTIK